jgi:hypothetical protein
MIARIGREAIVTDSTRLTGEEIQLDRRSAGERRQGGGDRRKEDIPVAIDRRKGERRKTQRRRQIDPTTCERDYTNDEIEFMQALDAYKRSSGRMFPTCSEILEVVRSLGYEKLSGAQSEEASDNLAVEGAEQPHEA